MEIEVDNPEAVAQRWSQVLDMPLEQSDESNESSGMPAIKLDNARIRFATDTDGRGLGIGAIDVAPADRDNILEMADKFGLRHQSDHGGEQLLICGVRVNLV